MFGIIPSSEIPPGAPGLVPSSLSGKLNIVLEEAIARKGDAGRRLIEVGEEIERLKGD